MSRAILRRSTLGVTALLLAALSLAWARSRSGDGDVQLVDHTRVDAAFAKGVPLIETTDYKIHASRREGPGAAEIHTRDTDIAYVIHGSAILVTGGNPTGVKAIGPEELRGTAIQGGETRQLEVGDVVVIPNGTPHWFKEVSSPFLYYVVKVRQAGRETTKGGV